MSKKQGKLIKSLSYLRNVAWGEIWIILIVGIIYVFLRWVMKGFPMGGEAGREAVIWCFEGIFFGFFTALIKNVGNTNSELKELIANLNTASLSVEILTSFSKLFQGMLSDELKDFFIHLPKEFGGIVIGADEKEYIKKLTSLIPITKKSFYATLRGGQHPQYTIRWFFEDSFLLHQEKLNYLSAVNSSGQNTTQKIRIIILEEKEMGDFCNKTWRDNFFDRSTHTDTYLISPLILVELLRDAGVSQTSFIMEDYAIFNENIALKHNGQNSLYLGVENQISLMCRPFEFVQNDTEFRSFKKIDKSAMRFFNTSMAKPDTKSWDEWKTEFTSNHPQELLETILKTYQSNPVRHTGYSLFCDRRTLENIVNEIGSGTTFEDKLKDIYNKVYISNRDPNKNPSSTGINRLKTDGLLT